MTEILPLGKKEMADLGLSFVTLPVPAFSSLTKSYVMNVYWFLDLEMVKEQCKSINPLIIFDTSAVYIDTSLKTDESKMPKEVIEAGTGYFLRAIVDIAEKEWTQVIDNVFRPKDIKYTFKWDFEHYEHVGVASRIERQQKEEERNKLNDLKQLEDMKQQKKNKR